MGIISFQVTHKNRSIHKISIFSLAFLTLLLSYVPCSYSSSSSSVVSQYFTTPDGFKIRYALFKPKQSSSQNVTLVLLQGRASFIEKNFDFIHDLTALGYDVATFDWRGMGGSDRILPHPQKNHIDSFDIYLQDIDQFITTLSNHHSHHTFILFGSSLGGQLALRYLHDYPHSRVKGAILSAPMLDVITKPYPRWSVGPLMRFMSWIGYGQSYAFGYGDYNVDRASFQNNRETPDVEIFQKTIQTIKQFSHYVTGGPTFGWVKAALESMAKTSDQTYLQQIKQPVLLMSAGQDKIVYNINDKGTCQAMPRCQYKFYPHAMHNLMKEKPAIRQSVLEETQHFIADIPGLSLTEQ